jgi:hypothetical protein
MTFTEAAVDVLRREGKPLHFRKIAEIAIRESLLDHVGKIPEETMADQLAAHCRLPRPERHVIAVQPGTFALAEWGLPEDPAGLDNLVERPPEGEPAYRARERHPIPSRDLARGGLREAGRGRRREEGEEKRRRFPPPAEVAYEILAGAERPLGLTELAALGAERLLMPDAFVREPQSLAAALREDNRRRENAGRRPLFDIEGDTVTLAAQPEPSERPVMVSAPRAPTGPAEMRRVALASLRRRLRECDPPTVEWLVARLLEKVGLQDVKVAKRSREHVVFTGRRRMGLADVRHCVRVVRSNADVVRRDVTEVRRDLGNYGAQIGMLVSAGEAGRDARGEATAAGQMPVVLLAGEALAEAFADAGVACRQVVIPEVDEAFLQQAAETAQRDESARRARREEREGRGEERERREVRPRPEGERREERERRPERQAGPEAERPPGAGAPAQEGTAGPARAQEPGAEPDLEGDEEAGEDLEEGDGEGEIAAEAVEGAGGAPAAEGTPPGEGRRRRRRRRRRGGRGRGERRPGAEAAPREGTAGPEPAPPGGQAAAAPSPEPAAPAAGTEAGSPPPPPAPSGAPE